MPRKPKKPCVYSGCPNLTEGRYCPEHMSKVNSEYEKYGRDPRTITYDGWTGGDMAT